MAGVSRLDEQNIATPEEAIGITHFL